MFTGFTATNKLYGVFEMAAVSYGYAVTTYAGQNLGAKNIVRIRHGVNRALLISLATSISIAALMFLFGGALLSLFIEKSADPEVLSVAKRYLFTMSAMLPVLYFLHVYRSALQGMGDTVMPMVSGLGECAMRVGRRLGAHIPDRRGGHLLRGARRVGRGDGDTGDLLLRPPGAAFGRSLVERLEGTVRLHQGIEVAALDDLALPEHDDLVKILHRIQPVRNGDHRPAREIFHRTIDDGLFGQVVDGGSRLVKQHHPRTGECQPGQGELLALAA